MSKELKTIYVIDRHKVVMIGVAVLLISYRILDL